MAETYVFATNRYVVGVDTPVSMATTSVSIAATSMPAPPTPMAASFYIVYSATRCVGDTYTGMDAPPICICMAGTSVSMASMGMDMPEAIVSVPATDVPATETYLWDGSYSVAVSRSLPAICPGVCGTRMVAGIGGKSRQFPPNPAKSCFSRPVRGNLFL